VLFGFSQIGGFEHPRAPGDHSELVLDLVYGFDDAFVVAPRNEDLVELPIESGKAVQVHPVGCVVGNFQ
jgi:hypothetical protein